MRARLLPAFSALLAVGLIGGNIAGYVGAEPKRKLSQTLLYLPDPIVARASSIGHRNLVSRLQWIDSFPYVSYQIDARDDTVAGDGRGGFTRLYETLIELDPKFEPYYDHAAMTISGLVSDHQGALVFLVRGVTELPHSFSRWQNYAAHLSAYYDLENKNRALFEAVLVQWARHMRSEAERAVPELWLQATARRQGGLSQIDYWAMRLRQSRPASKMADLAASVLREQIAAHHLDLLGEALVPPLPANARELRLEDLDRSRLPPPGPLGPLVLRQGAMVLDTDPWGWPYRLGDDGSVTSPGLEHRTWQKRISTLNQVLDVYQRQGEALESPQALEAATGRSAPAAPQGCRLDFIDGRFQATIPEQTPWDLRARLAD